MFVQQVVGEEPMGQDRLQWEKQARAEERVRWKTWLNEGERETEREEWGGREEMKGRYRK